MLNASRIYGDYLHPKDTNCDMTNVHLYICVRKIRISAHFETKCARRFSPRTGALVSPTSVAVTQHRTVARRVVVSLSCFALLKKCFFLPKPRVGGIPWPEAYQIKMIRPTSTLAPYKFTSKKGEVFTTWAPLPNPKIKTSLSKVKLSRLERLYQTQK